MRKAIIPRKRLRDARLHAFELSSLAGSRSCRASTEVDSGLEFEVL